MGVGVVVTGSSSTAEPPSARVSRGRSWGSILPLVLFAAFLAQIDIWAARQGYLPAPPLAFLAVFFLVLGIIGSRRPVSQVGGASPLGGLAAAWPFWTAIVLCVVWGLLRGGLTPAPIYDLRQALLPTVDFGVLLTGVVAGFLPVFRRQWRRVALLAFLLVLASLLIDGWIPGTFSKQMSRAAGFAGNPNQGGFRLVLLAAVSMRYLRPRRWDLVILAACGLGVFLTLSRGSLVLLGVLGFAVGLSRLLTASRPRSRRMWGATALGALALAALVVFAGVRWLPTLPQFDIRHAQARLSLLASIDGFLKGEQGTRLQLVRESFERIERRPFLGYGLGYASTLKPGPHNQFLKIWLDQGLVGVGLFCWMLSAAAAVFFRRRSVTGVVVIALLIAESSVSHNLLDDRTALLLLGLLLSVALGSHGEVLRGRSSNGMKPNALRDA